MRLKKQVGEHAHRSHRSTRILSHAENPSMRARFSGHVPKGQKFIAQCKRSDTLGIKVPRSLRKGKSTEAERVMITFTLAGRGRAWRFTQGVASLALG